jgi:succinoglycan biosynthesis protein ExoV
VKIHLVDQVRGNFGDELNRWLWNRMLPDIWDDADDGTLFVGIGTILDRTLPPARVCIVFGAGVGYNAAPADISSSSARWRIYGVRGPLTARALKLDKRLAMTDPAILLATLPEFKGLKRRGVIFIPHWKSVRYGYWQEICKSLGIEFVDPCQDSRWVVARIASAEKVVAESMHAAIIADAFRVPWIPVALSREVSPFKWVDWAASLDAPYSPACLPASDRVESLRNALLRWSVHSNAAGYPASSLVAQGARMNFEDIDLLMSGFEEVGRRINQQWRWNASVAVEVVLKRLAKLGLGHSTKMRAAAGAQMAELARGEANLSSDQSHERALDDVLNRFEDFKSDFKRGAFA